MLGALSGRVTGVADVAGAAWLRLRTCDSDVATWESDTARDRHSSAPANPASPEIRSATAAAARAGERRARGASDTASSAAASAAGGIVSNSSCGASGAMGCASGTTTGGAPTGAGRARTRSSLMIKAPSPAWNLASASENAATEGNGGAVTAPMPRATA